MTEDDERRAFAEAMRGVRPLKRAARAVTSTAKKRGRAALQPRDAIDQTSSVENVPRPSHVRHVSPRKLRDLKRGRLKIDDEIDLHGLTAVEARGALADFITAARRHGLTCVRVVHGKGNRSGPAGPVLKDVAQLWLAQSDDVLAFAEPGARHGGGGAVHVLLRQR